MRVRSGWAVSVEMRVQNLDRLVLFEQRLMRAQLAVFVAGPIGVVRHCVTVLANDGLGRSAVGIAIPPVGGNDAVIAVDDHEGLLVGVDQALKFDHHGKTRLS